MNRKKFLSTSTLALAALSTSTYGKVKKVDDEYVGDCNTTNDILGPFYRPKAPLRKDLTYPGLTGTVIQLQGCVYNPDCTTPLPNALVEIWHCNTEGEYDNNSKAFNLRARWYTDEEGRYSFKTILPGKYLNAGQFRPAHIHFRITAKHKKELISQIYFTGDPQIGEDPWASAEQAALRILPIRLGDTKGNLMVDFDVYLAREQ